MHFFYVETFTRAIQTSHDIANNMKSDQLAGLRKSANQSLEYKARAGVCPKL